MRTAHKKRYVWSLLIFAAVFAAELGFGIYLSVVNNFVYYDAVSRVANAFYVLYSRDPHLGAIGFVWNPLPSLLELGPLLLWPLIPAVAAAGLASNILTALFAAGASVLLFQYSLRSTGHAGLSLILAALYSLNPFIFLYGANGMSEAMFSFFIMWIVILFLKWTKDDHSIYPIAIGFALAAAFWIRYEAVAFGAGLALALMAVMLERKVRGGHLELSDAAPEGMRKLESTLIVMVTPAIFSGMAWIALNAIIMGDPLYFFRSGYSNLAFSGNITDEFRRQIETPVGALWVVLRKSLFFSLPLMAILLIRLLSRRWRRWDTIALLAFCTSIPAMQYVMLMNGSSFGWLRFFVYPFVIAAAWIPYELSALRLSRYHRAAAAIFCLSVLLSSLVILDMNNQKLSPDEYELFHIRQSGTYKDLTKAKEVAAYTNALIGQAEPRDRPLILTDSYSAYSVLLNSQYPRQWVITNDRDFMEILADPYAYGVDYVLVSRKIGAVLQIIHETYPGLFDHGTSWTELEKDFDGEWRLFRVTGSTSSTEQSS